MGPVKHLPVAITFCQIGLGLLTIHTLRSPAVVAMHTGFGALLLASLLAVYLLQTQVEPATQNAQA